MKRREFLYGLAAGVALATPAMAESVAESIVRQLKRLGFRGVSQERTLLGRVRIVATRSDGQREIIVNPKTGEILRDLWTPAVDGEAGGVAIIDDRRGGSGGDGDGGGDGGGGHGGGNSGSGGSGGGSDGDDDDGGD